MLPKSSDHPVRKFISAPAPMSTTSVLMESVHLAAALPAISKGKGSVPGNKPLPLNTLRSRSKAMPPANNPLKAKARACTAPSCAPPPASPCSARSVSAVAVPVGKASCSWLISWRLIGIAVSTPNIAISANHNTIGAVSGRTAVTINSAPKAAMLPPPVM